MRTTPIRNLFRTLDIKQALGKRRHEESVDDPIEDVVQGTPGAPLHAHTEANNALRPSLPVHTRMALQHEDHSEDAIVITTLETIPFCCHEDLIAMRRSQLLLVAGSLNAKLPKTLKIAADPSQSDRQIRKQIEFAVGITQNAPNAPKSRRIRSVNDVEETSLDVNPTPFSSPLAGRSRFYGLYSPSPRLERLDEADEEASPKPNKRRKVSSSTKVFGSADDDDVFNSPKIGMDVEELPTMQLKLPLPKEGLKTPSTRAFLNSYHNFDQSRTQCTGSKRKLQPRETPTSSYLFPQNALITPLITSTPCRRNGDRSRGSPYRSFMGSMMDITSDDSAGGGGPMFGLYGKMCESYDGDFVDMDFSP